MSAPRQSSQRRPGRVTMEVLYEDRDVVVVDKPAGLLTIATEAEKRLTAYAMVYDHLKRQRPPGRPFIVHRLDREASGLIVFARTEEAKYRLQDQFRDHSAGRTYVAVVEGRVLPDEFAVESYLAENAIHRCFSTPDPARGKWAVTHVRVLRRAARFTLVEVDLETGRKHQIRVHLAEQGHPIVGDEAYGSRVNPIRRVALHGARLAFAHPRSGEELVFESPLPRPFAAIV